MQSRPYLLGAPGLPHSGTGDAEARTWAAVRLGIARVPGGSVWGLPGRTPEERDGLPGEAGIRCISDPNLPFLSPTSSLGKGGSR